MDDNLMVTTDLLIQKLNDEVKHWQQLALDASHAGDHEKCRDALKHQGLAIDALIRLVETNRRRNQ